MGVNNLRWIFSTRLLGREGREECLENLHFLQDESLKFMILLWVYDWVAFQSKSNNLVYPHRRIFNDIFWGWYSAIAARYFWHRLSKSITNCRGQFQGLAWRHVTAFSWNCSHEIRRANTAHVEDAFLYMTKEPPWKICRQQCLEIFSILFLFSLLFSNV